MDDGNDTLTESCEGAVNFMVIEMEVGSLQKLPFGGVVEVKFGRGMRSGRRNGWYHGPPWDSTFEFVFYGLDQQTDTNLPSLLIYSFSFQG